MPKTPSPAFRIGQADFLRCKDRDLHAFRHADLQAEYNAGWQSEYKDMPR